MLRRYTSPFSLAAVAGMALAPSCPAFGQSFTTTSGAAFAQDGVGVSATAEGHTVIGRAYTGSAHRPLIWSFDPAGTFVEAHDVDMSGRIFIQATAPIPGGGTYCVGSVIPEGEHEHDGLLMRVTADNIVAWIQHASAPGDQQYLGVTPMPDGGAVVCGVSNTGGGKDILLRRFTPVGQPQWTVTEDLGSNEEYLAVAANAQGIIATGRVMSFGGTSTALFGRYTLAGEQLGISGWGGSGNDLGRAIIARSDGTFLMAGSTSSYGPLDPDVNRVRERVYLIAMNVQGDTLWTHAQGQPGTDMSAHCMAEAPNGDLLIGGERATIGLSDALLQRFSPTGQLLWERTIDTGREERLLGIEVDATGVLATGWSFGPDGRQVLLTRRNANGD